MARKVGYKVNCVLVGGEGTAENAKKLLPYGVDTVYVYEHPSFEGFRADCCADAVADCIAAAKPSSVLIGATALGRSLAPRLSTWFHTGLTADCTTLDIEPSTDMVQIRPAFGGNIMAQIAIRRSRPQFATVRYRVMDRAERVQNPTGSVVKCAVTDDMARSRIRILSSEVIEKQKTIDEEDILVVAGRGVRSEKDVEMCRRLAEALGGQLAFTRPMVENGFGDQMHQIGLSGRTVYHHLRRFGRHSVHLLHEGRRMHRRHQQRPGRADIQGCALLYRGRSVSGRTASDRARAEQKGGLNRALSL